MALGCGKMLASLDAPARRARHRAALHDLFLTPWVAIALLLIAVKASADNPAPAPARPSGPPIDVLELRVLGNTTLDQRTIESAVYPFTGPAKQMADIEAARAALERAYHDRGFGTVFVDIPEQSVDEGIVRLHVTEGRLHQVRVTGAKYFSGRQILAQVPAAQQNTVPNLPELQSQLTALNAETRDRTVVPVLKAGSQPGTVDLALRVDDHLPFHGSIELNNQYTADTSHLRAALQASYDDLFGRLDSFAIQYQVAPESPSQTHVFATSYTLRLAPDGTGLTLLYIDSKSDVATVGTLGVLGTGSIYGIRWMTPLPAIGSSQDLALEVDYKDFAQNILVNPTNGLNTPIDYINMSAAYSGARATQRLQADWTTTLDFGFSGAPPNAQQFADKRFGAEPNYFYIRSDGGVTWQLPAQFSATLRLTGQYSVDPLVNTEQLPIGGAFSVRGYLEAEELADSALRGSFQVGAPPLNFGSGHLHLNEFVFFDIARAFTVDPLPDQARHTDLRSWGAGFRFEGASHFYGTLTWADPLIDGARTQKGSSMLLFVIRGYL
jgi:hemolysin activation/secretion protein